MTLMNNKNKSSKDNLQLTTSKQVVSLVKLILIKFKNGQNIKNELSFLKEISSLNKNNFFEKLDIISLKKFYGFSNLQNEFDYFFKKIY